MIEHPLTHPAAIVPSDPQGSIGRRGIALGAAAMALMAQAPSANAQRNSRPIVAAVVYPGMILLDLVGPLTVFNIMGADVHLVWKDLNPVATDVGLKVTPTATPSDAPRQVDILFVPGGLGGTVAAMREPEILAFVTRWGTSARWVTSVCTGSLLLGAAGLLRGYSATSHWYCVDMLGSLGAKPSHDRVVVDRNRVTGGGVTTGIDFGLQLAALIVGEDVAKRIQLLIEYQPKPPFDAGEPVSAGPALTQAVLTARAPALAAARDAIAAASAQLAL